MNAMHTPSARPSPTSHRERGVVLILALIAILLLATSGFTMVGSVTSAKSEAAASEQALQRLCLAESGLEAALVDLRAGGTGQLGSASAPVRLGDGEFWTEVQDLGGGLLSIRSTGWYDRGRRVVGGFVRETTTPFDYAVFAGNDSGDPTYHMDFGGTGTQADRINGNVHSGGSLSIQGEAAIDGDLSAQVGITGGEGKTGVSRVGFDFQAVDPTAPGIVDVARTFADQGRSAKDNAGGTAVQVPESSPAHIFRLNPSDRTTETGGTKKNDYFLEDPYEAVMHDNKGDGSNPYVVSMDDGTGTTRRTYYIDGNLWIHNKFTLSLQLASSPAGGTQVTFIVRGNVYISDSFRMENPALDAAAFVALRDPAVPDSGNVYLGDPRYGTLAEMQAYLYAENDFIDINLDAKGSKEVRILGAMTAGNQVNIQRDSKGQHSKLTVDWDPRLQRGGVSLPFLQSQSSGRRVTREAWVELPPE